jgi:hypothetical protein
MWETFIRIGSPPEEKVTLVELFNVIRFKIYPMISDLRQKNIITWYSFLIHNRLSGVPTTEDDNSPYFHIRLSIKDDLKHKDDVNKHLPTYCEKHFTRLCKGTESISGIDKSRLKNEDITEAWRIIGEQSELIMNMLLIFKENAEIPPQQIVQFLHFFANMTQLAVGWKRKML